MDDKERENRTLALQCAVGHRLASETPEQVVEAAEKYFVFLQAPAKAE